MLFRRALRLILLALVACSLLAACEGGDPGEFQITMVAPFQTLAALTPGPAVYDMLTARAPANASVVQGLARRSETPTPARRLTLTPSAAAITEQRQPSPTARREPAAITPPPATATPRAPTATLASEPLPPLPPTPARPMNTFETSVYLSEAQSVGQLGRTWNLAALRIGVHPGMVRLVWELEDDGLGDEPDTAPLVRVVEVDNAQSPFPSRGSLQDPTWGAARIDVMLSDVYAYDVPLDQQLPTALPDARVVTKIGLHPTFDDAVLGFSIGLTRPAAYELFTLTDPVRVVVDVQTEP